LKRGACGMVCRLALVAVLIGLAVPASTSAPAGAAAGLPRLAYAYDGASVDGVFVVRVDGSDRHLVTHGVVYRDQNGDEIEPEWSPDGTLIAFNAARRSTWYSRIYKVHPNRLGQRRLSYGAAGDGCTDYDLDWSAHSQHIVFARYCEDVDQIWTVRRDGEQLRLLSRRGACCDEGEEEPNWSPDSRWIAYTGFTSIGEHQIWRMRRDGTGKTRLTGLGVSNPPTAGQPDWSPDSTTIIYTEWQSAGNSDVCTVPHIGGPRNCLTDAPGYDFDPHYSPDGAQIVYVRNAPFFGNSDIWIMEADGSNQHPLVETPGRDDQPVWSPDGEWIAFVSNDGGQVDLYVIHPGGSGLLPVTNNAGIESGPTWEPPS
jgi:Tol biopolymer transport system component